MPRQISARGHRTRCDARGFFRVPPHSPLQPARNPPHRPHDSAAEFAKSAAESEKSAAEFAGSTAELAKSAAGRSNGTAESKQSATFFAESTTSLSDPAPPCHGCTTPPRRIAAPAGCRTTPTIRHRGVSPTLRRRRPCTSGTIYSARLIPYQGVWAFPWACCASSASCRHCSSSSSSCWSVQTA